MGQLVGNHARSNLDFISYLRGRVLVVGSAPRFCKASIWQ